MLTSKEEIKRYNEKHKNEPVKVKHKNYDEIICKRCEKVINVNDTLKMVDGYHGICICPECGKANRVVKTRPADADYKIVNNGQRIRKDPKLHMSKKQRRKLNKELRNGK